MALTKFEDEVLDLLLHLEWAGDSYEGSREVECPSCNVKVDCETGLDEEDGAYDDESDDDDLSDVDDAETFAMQVTSPVLRGEVVPWEHAGTCRLRDMIDKLVAKGGKIRRR